MMRITTQLLQLHQAFGRFGPSEFLRFLTKQSIVDVQLGDQTVVQISVERCKECLRQEGLV